MKIMVTGAAGYIGSIVARDLATEHEVVGVDMRPMPNVPDSRVMDLNSYEEIFDALDGVEGIKSCKVDFESKTATIIFDVEKIDREKIAKTIQKGTYYKVMDLSKKEENSRSFWNWLFRIG